MLTEKETRDLKLKKHVGSIHCSNTLSLLQRKISNVLLYHAYDELLEKEEHVIAIKTLCAMIGYSSHDYDSIKRALKALISTVLEWNLLGDGKAGNVEDWNASSILASVGIKGGICTYAYSNRLKKLLYMPEIYGRINIAIQSRFKSNYALALYENCIRYQNLPYTRWFSLATFRKLMGVPENKYIIFRDFKRRVLDKSVAEVNQYSDIFVEPEVEREGFKINRLRFKLNKNDTKAMNEQHVEKLDQAMLNTLTAEFGFSPYQANDAIREFGSDFINQKINVVKTSPTYIDNKVKNVTAFLKSALREDYIGQQVSTAKVTATRENTNDQVEETLKKRYADYVSQTIEDVFNCLSAEHQKLLINAFEDNLKQQNNVFVLEKYHQKGFSNRIVKSIFRSYLKEDHKDLFKHMVSIEQFTTNQVKKLEHHDR